MFYLRHSHSACIFYQIFPALSTTFLIFFVIFQHLERNGEGGIWTLAPLLTTYSLSRGAPSATWVFLQSACLTTDYIYLKPHSLMRSGESGIRTHAPLRTNGFQDRLVMTTSISLHKRHGILYQHDSILSTTFFHFFYFFSAAFAFLQKSLFWQKFIGHIIGVLIL